MKKINFEKKPNTKIQQEKKRIFIFLSLKIDNNILK